MRKCARPLTDTFSKRLSRIWKLLFHSSGKKCCRFIKKFPWYLLAFRSTKHTDLLLVVEDILLVGFFFFFGVLEGRRFSAGNRSMSSCRFCARTGQHLGPYLISHRDKSPRSPPGEERRCHHHASPWLRCSLRYNLYRPRFYRIC